VLVDRFVAVVMKWPPVVERYLGCKQKLQEAANDRLGIEPDENG
jgi:hypothetical protein